MLPAPVVAGLLPARCETPEEWLAREERFERYWTRAAKLDAANRAKGLPEWLVEYDRRFDPAMVKDRYSRARFVPGQFAR